MWLVCISEYAPPGVCKFDTAAAQPPDSKVRFMKTLFCMVCMQANAVAGSAYYKMLIGRMLGYADENVQGYVRATGGGLTLDVIKQVCRSACLMPHTVCLCYVYAMGCGICASRNMLGASRLFVLWIYAVALCFDAG